MTFQHAASCPWREWGKQCNCGVSGDSALTSEPTDWTPHCVLLNEEASRYESAIQMEGNPFVEQQSREARLKREVSAFLSRSETPGEVPRDLPPRAEADAAIRALYDALLGESGTPEAYDNVNELLDRLYAAVLQRATTKPLTEIHFWLCRACNEFTDAKQGQCKCGKAVFTTFCASDLPASILAVLQRAPQQENDASGVIDGGKDLADFLDRAIPDDDATQPFTAAELVELPSRVMVDGSSGKNVATMSEDDFSRLCITASSGQRAPVPQTSERFRRMAEIEAVNDVSVGMPPGAVSVLTPEAELTLAQYDERQKLDRALYYEALVNGIRLDRELTARLQSGAAPLREEETHVHKCREGDEHEHTHCTCVCGATAINSMNEVEWDAASRLSAPREIKND